MSQPSRARSFVRMLIGLLVGGGLGALAIHYFEEHRAGVDWRVDAYNRHFSSCPLLASLTLFLGAAIALVVALLDFEVLENMFPGFFWQMPKGPTLFLSSLISLSLPPLFLWQA